MKMHHTGWVVNDIDSLIPFYRDVVGMKNIRTAVREGTGIEKALGYKKAYLKVAFLGFDEGHCLEMVQYLNPSSTNRVPSERNLLGASHLAFLVDNIQTSYEKLSKGGARPLHTPKEVAPGRKICYMQDPEGNWLELVESNE